MKKLLVALLILTFSHISYAQPQQTEPNSGGLEALKIAFISKQMNLTPEEAQKFWPVYNQYMSEFKKIRQEKTDDEIAFREKALDLIKKYRPEFLKCVGQDKFNRLLKSEGDWRQYLKDEINRRRELRQQIKRNRPGGN